MWRTVLKPILALVLLAIIAVAAAITANEPPILEPPGLLARITTYLSSGVAETEHYSAFPELRTRSYEKPPAQVFKAAADTARSLGWNVLETDEKQLILRAVAVTPVLGTEEDVELKVIGDRKGPSEIHMRSASRLKFDFGSNARRIVVFHEALERRL